MAEFWHGAIFIAAGQPHLRGISTSRAGSTLLPTVVGLLGIALAYVIIMLAPGLPDRLADARSAAFTCFLLNKWYFDELYDFIFVRPARGWPACSGRSATPRSSTACPNGMPALTARQLRARSSSIQTGRSRSMPSPC